MTPTGGPVGDAALLVVDVQPDFMPGGPLPVGGGAEIVAPIAELLQSGPFAVRVGTQDWHPAGHVSFATRHPPRQPFDVIDLYGHAQTLWPDHCVRGTPGAVLHPDLPTDCFDLILRKGSDPACDSYSGFRNNWNAEGARPSTGLAGYLRDRGIRAIHLCGLARDVCVRWTAEDAARAGFEVRVWWDLTRPVDSATDAEVRRTLEALGVEVVTGAPVLS